MLLLLLLCVCVLHGKHKKPTVSSVLSHVDVLWCKQSYKKQRCNIFFYSSSALFEKQKASPCRMDGWMFEGDGEALGGWLIKRKCH